MNKVKVKDARVCIAEGRYVSLYIPVAEQVSRILEPAEISYTAGLAVSVRRGLKEEICGAEAGMLTLFGDGLAVMPDIWKVTMNDTYPSKDETADTMDVQEFAMLCEMALSIISQLYLDNDVSSKTFIMGLEINKDNLGDRAIYNPWTGELKSHLSLNDFNKLFMKEEDG